MKTMMRALLALALIVGGLVGHGAPVRAALPESYGIAAGWPKGPGQLGAAITTLNGLALSTGAATAGSPFSASVINTTAGSTLTLIDSVGGKYSLSGLMLTGSGLTAGTDAPMVQEGLAGAANSPRLTTLSVTVSPAPASGGKLDFSAAANGVLHFFFH